MNTVAKVAIVLLVYKISNTHTCDPGLPDGKWLRAKDGAIPPGAIAGGVDKTLNLVYVCRTKIDSFLLTGRLNAGSKFCSTSYGTVEKKNSEYEVLTCATGVWVPIFDKGVISGSNYLPAGYQNKDPIYICRCRHENSIVVGKLHNGKAYFSNDGKEMACDEYEMFMSTSLHYMTYVGTVYILFGNRGPYFPFRVKASKNVAIALTNNKNILYEIILGGNDNTVSSIGKDRSRPFAASVKTTDLLNEDSYRGFWIYWHFNKISVGREGERTEFLSFTDSNIYQINAVGIKTHETNGSWAIEPMPFVFYVDVHKSNKIL